MNTCSGAHVYQEEDPCNTFSLYQAPRRRLFARENTSLYHYSSFWALADHFYVFERAFTSIAPESTEDELPQGHSTSILPTAGLLKPSLGRYQGARAHRGPRLFERFILRSFSISGCSNPADLLALADLPELNQNKHMRNYLHLCVPAGPQEAEHLQSEPCGPVDRGLGCGESLPHPKDTLLVSWSSAKYLSMLLPSTCETEPTAFHFWALRRKSALKQNYQGKGNFKKTLPFCCLWCEVKNCSSLQITEPNPSEVTASAEE